MTHEIYKFPRTHHLSILSDSTNSIVRDDKVMSETECYSFLSHEIVIEEKVDGANLGISFDWDANTLCQNRGEYLRYPYSGQWKNLSNWLTRKNDTLFEILTNRYIMFGEWCYAQHSIFYNKLPDWFLGFDIFDKEELKFLSFQRRDKIFNDISICKIPLINRGRFTLSELERMLPTSQFNNKPAEGIYLRFDQGDWLIQRAKLVRSEFLQSIGEHWSKKKFATNQIMNEIQA